jgi:hypothetical protein
MEKENKLEISDKIEGEKQIIEFNPSQPTNSLGQNNPH